MIQFGKEWNLKYFRTVNMNILNDLQLTQVREVEKFISSYSEYEINIGCFIGNLYKGNLLFNYIIDELLVAKLITSSCRRISYTEGSFLQQDDLTNIELILIDNLQFSLMTSRDKQIGVSLIDDLLTQVKFLFLNISRIDELEHMPHALVDLFEVSHFNFKFKE